MSGDGLLDTVELDQHGALLQAELVYLRRLAARQKASSAGRERRTGELRVCVKFVRAFTARYASTYPFGILTGSAGLAVS